MLREYEKNIMFKKFRAETVFFVIVVIQKNKLVLSSVKTPFYTINFPYSKKGTLFHYKGTAILHGDCL